MENVNKQLLDALKSVTLSEEDIGLERSVAPEEYDKARKLIANADAMIVKELKDIEESCHHKKPELFAMIQEYGAAEHSQNDGLAIHLLSKIKEAIAAAEQAQQAEPKEMDAVPAYAYRYAAHVMENIRCASQWCDCQAFGIADSWINETHGGTMLPVCQTCNGHGMIGGLLPNGGGYDSEPCPDCAAQKGGQ